ncbi:hypothetical protein WME90_35980 [Sorangium sp. So ce375]|uniref:hypothetical protein n=1 Tax=Sorangium sp. So ce375 TaxID=3133306 RepID=UPI003F5C904D
MKLRLSHFAAAAIVATLSSLAACSDDETTGSSETGGTTTGGSTSNGTGGDGSGGDGAGGGTTASTSSTSAGTGGGDPAVPATFETVRAVVAQTGCADATCHNGEAKPTLQDDDALYETLTTYISEGCGDIPVVTPGKPEESALVKLINGTCEGVERMPRGCNPAPGPENTCLPQAYIDAIEQWIADGAPQ